MRQSAAHAATAEEMATRQRVISVSEFFLKNRHLLGFDAPHKALVIAVKEAVDNSLDACEEAGILPDVSVELVELGAGRFRVAVEDNGPGIVLAQVPKIFGKLLYGSKFHKLSQSRGQQGIGISAAALYAQLTTGQPVRVVTRTASGERAWEVELSIETRKNRAVVHRRARSVWDAPHGTRIELELEGQHRSGPHSVLSYLKLVAIANPHASFTLIETDGARHRFERSTTELPPPPVEMKPHPHGVELGRLIAMLEQTRHKHLGSFLRHEFSEVGQKTADAIIDRAGHSLTARSYPRRVARQQAAALHRALGKVPVRAPPACAVTPIGEARILEGLEKELAAELYFAVSRAPAVYRGNPFQVEVGIAYGRPEHAAPDQAALLPKSDEPARVLRFANRVPLLFQQSGCAVTRAIQRTRWKGYGIEQPKGALPVAPMVILVHVASVWVPFTSESKEAIAAYPEIVREIELALRQCGRKLRAHVLRRKRQRRERERRARIETYLPHVAGALESILGISAVERAGLVAQLDATLARARGVKS
jgi:DNA topoisomerase-6 subunit B